MNKLLENFQTRNSIEKTKTEKKKKILKVKNKSSIIFKGSFRFDISKGDWICKNKKCKNINLSKRKECNQCGMAKDINDKDIVKDQIKKSTSQKNDWKCNKC